MNSITKSRTLKVLVLFVAAVATVMIAGEQCSNQWETIISGESYSFGLMKNGSLLAWGENDYGQVGAGDKIRRHFEPVLVKSGAKWLQIATKSSSVFGILFDGTLWGWGWNNKGQLGDGTKEDRLQPVQIGKDNDWIMIAAGETHVLAIKKGGSLWVFGYGFYGQLGNGAEGRDNIILEPTRIQADHKWKKVFAGKYNSFAIREDGTLFAWGSNGDGQLGDNTETRRLIPVQIAPQIKWKEISAGIYHTLGLDIAGNLYAWATNGDGQLGDGTNVKKHVPTRIGNGKWRSIAVGLFYSVGLMEDGTLFAWGANHQGQFGDGTKQARASPFQIGKGFVWKHVAVGQFHTIGVTNEGYMMTWGDNKNGQLGNGDESKKEVLAPSVCSGTKGVCFQDKCESSCPEGFHEVSKVCHKCQQGTHFDQKTKSCVPKTGILRHLRQFIMKKLQ